MNNRTFRATQLGFMEIDIMYTKSVIMRMSAPAILGAAAVACALSAGTVSAKEVAVSVQVSHQGLDLSKPADAKKFYTRLQNAAWLVCTRGTRADLLPADDPIRCVEKALGDAVHASNQPLVTQIYLATHTLREAAAHGIEVSAQVAAK
jgi:UrcA family protein